jgi:hypothetical protein
MLTTQTKKSMFLLDYNYKKPKVLFGTQNAKTVKGEELGYTTFILYMSPHKQNTLGKNICPSATEGCASACLFTAGRGKFNSIQLARLHKTEFFLNDKETFMLQIVSEINKGIKKHGADKIAIRLNGTSDIPYENIQVGEYKNIMEMFPTVQFYDYTKVFSRLTKTLPANYHLTFSRAETHKNKTEAIKALELGFNVAAVFAVKDETQLPFEYNGVRVINGDLHDLTFLHDKHVIVGLKSKGDGKKDTSGFVIKDF